MTALNVNPNFDDADAFYAALIDAHRGLDDARSAALNARLILLLANHVGTQGVLLDALAKARASVDADGAP
jgi:Protein of unknown function (DUF2783)